MAEVKLRFNLDAEEVELVVDNEVALTSGKDVFLSWVEAYNTKNPPLKTEPVKVEAPVPAAPVKVEEPVAPTVTPETPAVEVNTDTPEVDNTDKE